MLDKFSGAPRLFEMSRRNFRYLYLCNKCKRSFDSKIELAQCKFCNHIVLELSRSPLIKDQNFRFYCVKCEKNFISSMLRSNCEICGNKILHFYSWSDISTYDRIDINMRKILRLLRFYRCLKIIFYKNRFRNKEELPTL